MRKFLSHKLNAKQSYLEAFIWLSQNVMYELFSGSTYWDNTRDHKLTSQEQKTK